MPLPINEIKAIKQFCIDQYDCGDCPFRKGVKRSDLSCYIGYPNCWNLDAWEEVFHRKNGSQNG